MKKEKMKEKKKGKEKKELKHPDKKESGSAK
jgi:hypothetical protein